MKVRGIVWLGTRTDRWEEMTRFCKDVFELSASHEERDFALFRLADGSTFEVFGPSFPGGGHPEHGAVAGFHVDDLDESRTELEAAGCEIVHLEDDGGDYAWLYFRAPDGNLYELTSGPYRTH
jgi:catechol 2,3-dioxygenase-like lactoylglutathione lyase family enzyme